MQRIIRMVLVLVVVSIAEQRITILAEDNWFPYSAVVNGKAQGIAEDIVSAVYKASGVEVDFRPIDFETAMTEVRDGKAIACLTVSRTRETEDKYLWHDQKLFSVVSSFYCLIDNQPTITAIENLEGKRLGLTQGYEYGDLIYTNQKIYKEYCLNDEVIIQKLLDKKLDYIILYNKTAEYLLDKLGVSSKVRQAGINDEMECYLAFSRSNPASEKYIKHFNKGMSLIVSKGDYAKIVGKWDVRFSH